jgi:hypothetical protein
MRHKSDSYPRRGPIDDGTDPFVQGYLLDRFELPGEKRSYLFRTQVVPVMERGGRKPKFDVGYVPNCGR